MVVVVDVLYRVEDEIRIVDDSELRGLRELTGASPHTVRQLIGEYGKFWRTQEQSTAL